jgi:hypothetical protein
MLCPEELVTDSSCVVKFAKWAMIQSTACRGKSRSTIPAGGHSCHGRISVWVCSSRRSGACSTSVELAVLSNSICVSIAIV